MRGSLLGKFIAGARGLLAVQLFVSVLAVALAGWTIAVTGEAMRERDRLQERVIQLEGELAARGIVPPPAPSVLTASQNAGAVYPGAGGNNAAPQSTRSFGAFISDIFAPPPPINAIVLHVRAEAEVTTAQQIAHELQRTTEARVTVSVANVRQPGYVYYDGRQNRPAAEFVAVFHDLARQAGVAEWAAQLRGEALPAQGAYTASRLDIVLPPLPPLPPVSTANAANPAAAAPPE